MDVRSGFEQGLEQRQRRAVAIARGQFEGEQAVEVVGQHGDGEVEVDLAIEEESRLRWKKASCSEMDFSTSQRWA